MVLDDAEVAKAKALAAGPLGEKMGKFPLLFAKAAFFGERPSRSREVEVNNGTVTLANLGNGPIAITCQHVIAGFREKRKEAQNVIFQLGFVDLDPLAQLIDGNERLDLATIRLTEKQAKAITSEGEIGSCVFKPVSWPPPLPTIGDFVAFGGFPGTLRTILSFDELEFGSWSSGASEVSSVSDFQFASVFDRENWVQSFGTQHHMDLIALGGMSGGPVFIKRKLHWDLVGIVSQYHENYDTVLFASLRPLRQDGTIEPPPV
jgi:hypothetical protein